MYIFIRKVNLRNFYCNDIIKNRRCHHAISAHVSRSVHLRKYLSLIDVPTVALRTSTNCFTYNSLSTHCLFGTDDRIVAPGRVDIRNFSLTPIKADKEPLKPSSKVEVTVQAIKNDIKNKETLPAEVPKVIAKKSLRQRIVDEILHYYHGFRLLFIDIRVSGYLVWRILNGKSLSRREHRLLVRTVGDMFRLLPFSVFVIVPFMELLLPVAIKLFPGMLPSTFQTSTEREDKLKQNLKMKLEMAKFLQKTLDDMAVQHKDRNSQMAKEFTEWFTKVRTSGEMVSNEDIMKFSQLFQDEITLDSLSRGQLVALCRVLEVQTLGMNNLLRFQLRMKLRSLAADDKLIHKEGIEALTVNELQQACRARGMRAYGMPEERLKMQLSQWLDLSLNKKVPPSLLLLSRALMLPETIPTSDKLKATISALPDTIVAQTKAAIGESEGKIDNMVRLEALKEEVRKVKEERKELQEERKRKEQEQKEVLVDKAPVMDVETTYAEFAAEKEKLAEAKKKTAQITSSDIEVLEHALDTLAKGKHQLIVEKEHMEDLKEEMADYQEDLQELKKVTADVPKPEIRETKGAKRLFKSVNKMIKKMDVVLTELENKEQKLKKDLAGGESNVTTEDIIRIDELLDAIKKIQKLPDESVLQQIENILGKMDDDRDGSIKVEDVLKVIEVIGKENVQLNTKQVDELIELIDKEEILEVEDKIEKALQKVKETQERKMLEGKSQPLVRKTESLEECKKKLGCPAAAKPDPSAAKSDASATKPDGPATKTDAPATKPDAPVTKADAPVTKADAQVPVPPEGLPPPPAISIEPKEKDNSKQL